MRKNVKVLLSIFLCTVLLITFSSPAFAKNNGRKNSRSFKDVPEDFWAFDDIMWMLERKIIDGVGNDLFKPNDKVSRAEFAKMMINTLNLQCYSPEEPSFLDVRKGSWEYSYVEGAKAYLTGFRAANGDYFRPSQNAVREDMAVALVKALGYHNEPVNESNLNIFADAGQISQNLRKYVALSVKYDLLKGYKNGNQTLFKPMESLTRAEAAALLYRAFKNNEEKITYDDDKVTYDDEIYIKPDVSVATQDNKLYVSWNKINSTKLKGYKVVISQNDSSPSYPDNGYLYYITDRDRTYAIIDNSTSYTGNSDFGPYLKKNEKYYISVTAVYDDRIVAGNAVRKTYPGANSPDSYIAPNASISIVNGKLVLNWDKIDSSYLNGYKVVISKNDSTPKYPENGYLYYITDRNKNFAVINNEDKYNDGDFGNYLTKGEKYYFSVTAVYNDRNVAGNAVRAEYIGAENPELYVVPVMTADVENGHLVLRWNKIESPNLVGYRVAASKNDSTPSYPENGYYCSITDRNKIYTVINNKTAYTDSDFGDYFIKGEKYYFSVTAVYKDRNIAGNTIRCLYDGEDNQELFPTPSVSASYDDNGKLVVKWNKIDSPQLVEYRLVISQNNQSPVYPANGCYNSAYDADTASVVIDTEERYKRGDFEKLTDGTEYYFSVTAVYKDNKYVAGNAVKVLFLLPPEQ